MSATRTVPATKRPATIAVLRKHLEWCCDTLENAASVIDDMEGDDIDGEGAEVRERVKEMREVLAVKPRKRASRSKEVVRVCPECFVDLPNDFSAVMCAECESSLLGEDRDE
jgi:hypothetical protein